MYNHIIYKTSDAIATINLDRPEGRNAQNQQLLEELNAAWEQAAADDSVRVILLRANGPHFSAGHDMSPEEISSNPAFAQIRASQATRGLLGLYSSETKDYFGFSRRWRDIPKPPIAAALQSCFDIHQLGHASAYAQSGQFVLMDHRDIEAADKK